MFFYFQTVQQVTINFFLHIAPNFSIGAGEQSADCSSRHNCGLGGQKAVLDRCRTGCDRSLQPEWQHADCAGVEGHGSTPRHHSGPRNRVLPHSYTSRN